MDSDTLWQTDRQQVTPPKVKIMGFELIYEGVLGRSVSDLARRLTSDVETGGTPSEETSLDDAFLKRTAEWQSVGPPEALQGERWNMSIQS